MHEFALAEGVATAAVDAARRGGLTSICRIVVAVGEMQQIERELFSHALKEVMPQIHAELACAEVEVRTQPAVMRCRACGCEFGLDRAGRMDADQAEAVHFIPELAHTYLRCPECDSPDFAVEQGRGVWLESVEGEQR